MIGIGIIGCGKITQVRHAPEYLKNPHCVIRALYDINSERAQQLAEEYHADAEESYQKLLARDDIDAVSVCVTNAEHAKVTIDALKAGKHVLCEKPMAISIEECEQMSKTADETGKVLLVGHNQRLLNAHKKCKELIANGEIGRVLTFSTNFGHSGPEKWSIDKGAATWFFDKNRAAFGAMFDLGIHKVDLIQYLLGDKIVSAVAEINTLDKTDHSGNKVTVDDNGICVVRTEKGALGCITASWTYYGAEDNCTRIYGTEGQLRVYDDPMYSLVVEKQSGEKMYYQLDKIQTNDNQDETGTINDFIDAIVNGKDSPNFHKNALQSMRAVFTCIEAGKTGKKEFVSIG